MPVLKKTLAVITGIYWVLLLYIIAALVWWFISLEAQNKEMTGLRLQLESPSNPHYATLKAEALELQRRNHAQYIGEGTIFLLLIVVGAVFVYRATRRQWQLSQQQQNFMMAVTHELKTPISITKLNLETLSKHRLDPVLQEKIIQKTLHETDRLNDLCNNILLASRLEGGNYHFHKESLLLNEIAMQSVHQFSGRYPDRIILLDADQIVPLAGDPLLIKMLINNLLDNALKYAPKDKPVEVKVFADKEGAQLWVSDVGPGIPQLEKELIFEKFYRMGNEQTRSSKGTGLGLYLCSKIARDHRGTLTVSDNVPHGSIFKVVFKK
jgi:two-component system, OmpR family, sensor histidine kinase CiaH